MCGYFCIGFIDFMLAGKKLTDFTSLFSPYDFKKNDDIIWVILKMNEIDKTNLTDQTKFRINEISNIENYFNSEIDKKNASKKLSKYVSVFDYIDKILIVLSATTRWVCIISHATVIGAPVGITSAGFTSLFSLATRIIKKLSKTTRNEKKKHDKIPMLAWNKK